MTKLLAQYLALQAPKKTSRRIAKEVGLRKGFATSSATRENTIMPNEEYGKSRPLPKPGGAR